MRLKFETRGQALHLRLLPPADALAIRRETLCVAEDPAVGWVQLWSDSMDGEPRLIWDSRHHDAAALLEAMR